MTEPDFIILQIIIGVKTQPLSLFIILNGMKVVKNVKNNDLKSGSKLETSLSNFLRVNQK